MDSILFTGSSGFLGNNLLPLLLKNYNVTTMGIGDHNNICVNLAKDIPIINNKYTIVLHAAGKAHVVPKTEKEKQEFFDINLQGTINLCLALERDKLPQSFIFISTVAVYGLEEGENITEEYPLNGKSPYALSKIEAEFFLINWCNKNNVMLSILRPSLIAGKNPSGNLRSMIQGINTGKYLSIGNGKARKSMFMANDIINLIPKLILHGGIYNVCDDYNPSFAELEALISKQLNKRKPHSIPYWIAKSMALAGDLLGSKAPINSSKLNKITKSLTFSNHKIKKTLDWIPLDVLSNFEIF